jgi:hypothetical protein
MESNMLRKTKTQNSLNLFSMPEEPTKVADTAPKDTSSDKPTVGSFTTTGKQSISESFFGKDDLSTTADIAETVSKAMENERRSGKEHLAELSEQQKSRSLKGFDPMTSNGSSIISANAGEITDMGGPKRVKTPALNTIFDPWANQREAEKIGDKTEGQVEKERVASNRRTEEQERMDTMVEKLRSTDQTKASSVHRTGTGDLESTDFKASRNNMSIFDSSDFERIPEKTGGEIISENVAERNSQIDESWRQNGKSLKSSEVTNRFFDSLVEKLDSDGC